MWIALLSLATAAEPSPELQACLGGDFAIASSAAQYQATVDQAVAGYLEPMNFAIRMFAEDRLTDAAMPCLGYKFTADGSTFTVQCDAEPRVEASINGAQGSYTNAEGKVFKVTFAAQGDEASLTFKGEEADQTTRYRCSGDALTVTREILPHSLGEILRVSYGYQKK